MVVGMWVALITSRNATGYEDEAENTWEPTDNLDCEDKILDIDQNLRDLIKGNSFQDLTGCNYGYPDNVSEAGAQLL